ncbi:MAG: bifunctional [glutamate--ammonia ligase]-adenylyl-L-tyrosine phosphorylase/[glutamate--ammonia-ligase] adenylyltransferase [Betaproteobacteria bacterium]|nr:bifunctional [glutamate--ammonia ligase]-adenylyl-L-tyrosine phosphorylase/[glutamate--ammonia-ligase] adenylyltransferase [Betaproteobacteria bacterium]
MDSKRPPPLSEGSRFYQRLQRRYADVFASLPSEVPQRESLTQAYTQLRTQGLEVGAALRVLRQWTMARLLTLDCEHQASLETVTLGVTHLAEVALDAACQQAFKDLDARHGVPLTSAGKRAEFWVIGMGKLGARELNVSSDIDLIYVYDEDGETTGNEQGLGKISVQEYFARAVKAIYTLIGDTTEHGFVFRVDLALRPNGNSGPSVVSLGALEEYLLVQGREWERFAWMKSRVIAPRSSIQNGSAANLRSVVLPFVFRRYLDYNVFESLRTLHQQIRDHAAKRSAGHPERANDVKLSRGGIREIEQVEHRIQYLDDQQTHVLPTHDHDLTWIANTMGYADSCDFLSDLDAHREIVAHEFDILLGGDRECKGCQTQGTRERPELEKVLDLFTGEVRQRLAHWQDSPKVQSLRDDARGRLMRLLQRTAQWLKEKRVEEVAVVRMADWMEPLMRRESYLAMMLERPAVHERLLRLLGAAKWPARYLVQHPGVIDELAGGDVLKQRFVAADFEAELEARRAALKRTGEDDEENLLNLLRRAHHAEVFRTLARDVEGNLTVEQVADDLSAMADAVLRVTASWCWSYLKNRHRDEPQFGIIAYGKLGGKELGYGSDLDIVFVFEDADERAQEVYAAFVRKLINWFTVKTAEGDLFEIDTALRPNGSAGLLVTTFDAYADYQQQRGSNTAWTWEHQAMTRARFVMGNAHMQQRFDQVRLAVISAHRDPQALAQEIVSMRNRVRGAHPIKHGFFDVKHSPGAMVDAEFAVQYLVLTHTAAHPDLADNVGNIALLQRAEAAGLLPPGVGIAASSAYRELRRVQHKARLNEEPTQVEGGLLKSEQDAVLALWQAVFSADNKFPKGA